MLCSQRVRAHPHCCPRSHPGLSRLAARLRPLVRRRPAPINGCRYRVTATSPPRSTAYIGWAQPCSGGQRRASGVAVTMKPTLRGFSVCGQPQRRPKSSITSSVYARRQGTGSPWSVRLRRVSGSRSVMAPTVSAPRRSPGYCSLARSTVARPHCSHSSAHIDLPCSVLAADRDDALRATADHHR